MKKLILVATSLLVTLGALAEDVKATSPDGRLVVNVSCEGGRLYYDATLDGQRMLEKSALGLKTSIGDFTRGLSTVNSSHDYKATKAVIDIENKDHQRFSIIFQVSNNDIAFRYSIPRQNIGRKEMKRVRIKSELSSFNFPDGTTTFISPQIGPETGWEQTKPSYEEGYSADAPMDAPSQYGHGYIFPALFHYSKESWNQGNPVQGIGKKNPRFQNSLEKKSSSDYWILLSETGVGSNYCGSHLSDYQSGVGYTVAYPDAGENNGYGTDFAAIPLPGETPWRTITLGHTLKPIAETTISYDLVEPLYEPSTDYKPGRYTWSWLIWQDKSINYDDQVKFIDLASAMGFEYCLVDNWWDTQIGRDRIEELS